MGTRRLLHKKKYPLSFIGNMDKTPPWIGPLLPTGVHSAPIRTTGHERNRFTVCLCAMADGRKLKPYVVFKGVRPIPELRNVPGMVVSLSRNGWTNEKLTEDWAKHC